MPTGPLGPNVDALDATRASAAGPQAALAPNECPARLSPQAAAGDRIGAPATLTPGAQLRLRAAAAPGPTIARLGKPHAAALNGFTSEVIAQGVWSQDRFGTAVHTSMPCDETSAAKDAIPEIVASARKYGITDPNQVAYLIATAHLEGRSGAAMHEGGNGDRAGVLGHDSYFDRYEPGTREGRDLGNTMPGDGERFEGRGFVQVTGRANYAALSDSLGLPENDLIDHPEKLETDRGLAADAMSSGLTRPGGFTGAGNLDALIPAGRSPGAANFYHARAAVNGISPVPATIVSNEAKAIAPIVARYESALFGTNR